jgi:ketosteroid isomerase-like protein
MKRRDFIAVSGMLLASTACVPDVLAEDDVAFVKRLIEDWYSTYYTKLDKQKYLAMLTEDYLLLENGEIFDAEGDIALMPRPEDEYRRKDAFDFRSVKIRGDFAYAIYFLKSEMNDKKNGKRSREWLESAILRRNGKTWRVALLHSTRIVKT